MGVGKGERGPCEGRSEQLPGRPPRPKRSRQRRPEPQTITAKLGEGKRGSCRDFKPLPDLSPRSLASFQGTSCPRLTQLGSCCFLSFLSDTDFPGPLVRCPPELGVVLFICLFVFAARGLWDPSSPTRDRTRVPCSGRRSPNHWTAKNSQS